MGQTKQGWVDRKQAARNGAETLLTHKWHTDHAIDAIRFTAATGLPIKTS